MFLMIEFQDVLVIKNNKFVTINEGYRRRLILTKKCKYAIIFS